MHITIRPLNPTSDIDLEQLQAIEVATSEHLYGASERPSIEQLRVTLAQTEYRRLSYWLAIGEPYEGGEIAVGYAQTILPLTENLGQQWAHIEVHPAHRGQGVGTLLLDEAVMPAVRASGRRVVASWGVVPAGEDADDPSAPANRLAARLGIGRRSLAICRTLDLHPEPDLLADLEAQALEKLGEYRVLVWQRGIPEEHLAGYGRLMHQLDLDDPDEDFENEAADYTPERLRHQEQRLHAKGERAIIAVAQAPSGELVGNSVIEWHTGARTTLARQENTLVMPEHRGHRLGLALKAAAHRALAEEAPGLTRIVTWNSHVNPWMIAINEQLGYEAAYQEVAYQGEPRL